jgi:hypothetical protein
VKKIPVEKCVTLDVQALKHAGYFAPGTGRQRLDIRPGDRYLAILTLAMGEGGFSLEGDAYPLRGSIVPVRCTIELVRTPAINRGERVWFACPVCRKPVGKLYLPPGGKGFACRDCHGLTYASRLEEPNIWKRANEELPKLVAELHNPRIGLKRVERIDRKIQKLRAQMRAATIQTENTLSPAFRAALAERGFQFIGGSPRPVVGPEPLVEPDPEIAEKRPRGRPKKVKGPYARKKLFHQNERRTQAEGFCVKCRAYRQPPEWNLVTFRNGRPALQGVCPICGSTMARIISARTAGLVASAQVEPLADIFGSQYSGDPPRTWVAKDST